MNKNGWHLIWALPLAMVPAFFTLWLSTIEWCGTSGCGADRIVDPNRTAAVLWLIVSGAIAAFPVFAVAWSPKRELRFMIALSYASVVGMIGLLLIAPWRS